MANDQSKMSEINEKQLENGPRGFPVFSPGQLSGTAESPLLNQSRQFSDANTAEMTNTSYEEIKAHAVEQLAKFFKNKNKQSPGFLKNIIASPIFATPSPIKTCGAAAEQNNNIQPLEEFQPQMTTPKATSSSRLFDKPAFGESAFSKFSSPGFSAFSTSTPKPEAGPSGQNIKKPDDIVQSPKTPMLPLPKSLQPIGKDIGWPPSPTPAEEPVPVSTTTASAKDERQNDPNLTTYSKLTPSFINFMNNSEVYNESSSAQPYQEILVETPGVPINTEEQQNEECETAALAPSGSVVTAAAAVGEDFATDDNSNLLGSNIFSEFFPGYTTEKEPSVNNEPELLEDIVIEDLVEPGLLEDIVVEDIVEPGLLEDIVVEDIVVSDAIITNEGSVKLHVSDVPSPLFPPLDIHESSEKISPPNDAKEDNGMEVDQLNKPLSRDYENIGGWISKCARSTGDRYYYNSITGESVWDEPKEWVEERQRRKEAEEQAAAAAAEVGGQDEPEHDLMDTVESEFALPKKDKQPVVAKRVGKARRGGRMTASGKPPPIQQNSSSGRKQVNRKRKAPSDEQPQQRRPEKIPKLEEKKVEPKKPVGSARRAIISDDEEDDQEQRMEDVQIMEIGDDDEEKEEVVICPPPIFDYNTLPKMRPCEVHCDLLTPAMLYELTGHYSLDWQPPAAPSSSQDRPSTSKNEVQKKEGTHDDTSTILDDDSLFAESPKSPRATRAAASTSITKFCSGLGGYNYFCFDCNLELNKNYSNYKLHMIKIHNKFVGEAKPVYDYLRTLTADQLQEVKFFCENCEASFQGEHGMEQLDAHKLEKNHVTTDSTPRRRRDAETPAQIIARIFAEAPEAEENNVADSVTTDDSASFHTALDDSYHSALENNATITLENSLNDSADDGTLEGDDCTLDSGDNSIICLDSPAENDVLKPDKKKAKSARFAHLLSTVKIEKAVKDTSALDESAALGQGQNSLIAGTSRESIDNSSQYNSFASAVKQTLTGSSAEPNQAAVSGLLKSAATKKTPKSSMVGASSAIRFRSPRFASTPNDKTSDKGEKINCPHCPRDKDASFKDQLSLNAHIIGEHGIGKLLGSRNSTASSVKDDSQQPSTSKAASSKTSVSKPTPSKAKATKADVISPRRSLPMRKAAGRQDAKPTKRRSERLKN